MAAFSSGSLEAELVAQQRLNFELQTAAETSRNFKASADAGYVDLDLGSVIVPVPLHQSPMAVAGPADIPADFGGNQ